MAHRIYRIIKSDELARAVELEYIPGGTSEIDGLLMIVKNENDDEALEDLTVPTQSSLFDGWAEFPFGSHDQISALSQNTGWNVLRDASSTNRKWAT